MRYPKRRKRKVTAKLPPPDVILELMRQGHVPAHIAAQHGVTRAALYMTFGTRFQERKIRNQKARLKLAALLLRKAAKGDVDPRYAYRYARDKAPQALTPKRKITSLRRIRASGGFEANYSILPLSGADNPSKPSSESD